MTTQSTPIRGAGDEVPDAAFRELYDSHAAVLLSFLIRLTQGDRHRAEDLLQETLIRAWRHPEARGPDGRWSRAWLFTVAKRIAIDHQRALQARVTEYGDDRLEERPHDEDVVERLIDIDELRAALAAMPDRLREVLVEVHLRERSVAEAAETLRVPAGTVKSRTFYAMKALREELIARGFDVPARQPRPARPPG